MDVAQQPARSLIGLMLERIFDALYYMALGVSGGTLDLGYLSYLETADPPVLEAAPIVVPPRRFEAYTDCPKCGAMDYHLLRAPSPPLADTYVRAQLAKLVPVGTSAPVPVDESQFEVIRICQCGFEWGQL